MVHRQIIGKFVWFELDTPNPEQAKAFYSELIGWKIEAMPMSGGSYEIIKTPSGMIGGISEAEHGSASHWISYLSVADVDASAKKVAAAGGKIITPAYDYPNVGRISLIADPQGARLFLFRQHDPDPADVPSEHGDWFWNELTTSDAQSSARFYHDALGFDLDVMEMEGFGKYYVLKTGQVPRGGLAKAPVASAPAWLPYVHVERVDETTSRALKLGGTVLVEPTDIPTVGRFSMLHDPVGASIALITPAPTP